MKKFIYFVVIIAVCIVVALAMYHEYNPSQDEIVMPNTEAVANADTVINFGSPEFGVQTYDFERTLTLDQEYVTMNYGDNLYYESTIVLDHYLDEDCESFNPVAIRNVFQAGEVCIFINHNQTPAGKLPSTIYETFNNYYMECIKIDLPVAMNLKRAIERLNETDIVKPHSNLVVLRNPMMPPFDGPYYIVGNFATGFIKINSNTGEVSNI